MQADLPARLIRDLSLSLIDAFTRAQKPKEGGSPWRLATRAFASLRRVHGLACAYLRHCWASSCHDSRQSSVPCAGVQAPRLAESPKPSVNRFSSLLPLGRCIVVVAHSVSSVVKPEPTCMQPFLVPCLCVWPAAFFPIIRCPASLKGGSDAQASKPSFVWALMAPSACALPIRHLLLSGGANLQEMGPRSCITSTWN
jgi:hypothetical protein